MKTVYIFTLNGCSHCSELRKKLTDQSISFNDIEISKNRGLWDKIVEQTGYDILPTIFIQENSDGSGTVYTPGRDFQDINEIIEIIKKNI